MPFVCVLLAAEGHGAYDWHGDYVSIAVKGGNVAVLNVLLEGGYELKWQQAQVRQAQPQCPRPGCPASMAPCCRLSAGLVQQTGMGLMSLALYL